MGEAEDESRQGGGSWTLQILVSNFGPRIQNDLMSFNAFETLPSSLLLLCSLQQNGWPHLRLSSENALYNSIIPSLTFFLQLLPRRYSSCLGNNSGDYQKLVQTLNDKYGVPTVVAKVSRIDWLRNAVGLVDPNYWRGSLKPRPVLDWYLKRIHDAVQEAKELAEG